MGMIEVADGVSVWSDSIRKLRRYGAISILEMAGGESITVNRDYHDLVHELSSCFIPTSGYMLGWWCGTHLQDDPIVLRPVVGFRVSTMRIEPIIADDADGPCPSTGALIAPDGKVTERSGLIHDNIGAWAKSAGDRITQRAKAHA